jgi:predicted RNase H-like HicB family nuclease
VVGPLWTRPAGLWATAGYQGFRYSCGMSVDLTAIFKPVPEGFIAFVEELPGANAQGATLEEARANLQEAVTLVLQANRDLAEEELASSTVIRERFRLSA